MGAHIAEYIVENHSSCDLCLYSVLPDNSVTDAPLETCSSLLSLGALCQLRGASVVSYLIENSTLTRRVGGGDDNMRAANALVATAISNTTCPLRLPCSGGWRYLHPEGASPVRDTSATARRSAVSSHLWTDSHIKPFTQSLAVAYAF